METTGLSDSPFAVLTFIAAPALLTNATSLLAMSTINRLLRTRDRMQALYDRSLSNQAEAEESAHMVDQVDRVERQAVLLLGALRSIYVALGAFVSATLVTLLGAGLARLQGVFWLNLLAGVGVLMACVGVGGIVHGCWNLFHATQLSLITIAEEAQSVRDRQGRRSAS